MLMPTTTTQHFFIRDQFVGVITNTNVVAQVLIILYKIMIDHLEHFHDQFQIMACLLRY